MSTFRDSRPPKKFPDYIALMSNIIDCKASCFKEEAHQKAWWYVVLEYTSIMKNDVWDIVPRSEGKSIVSSRWQHSKVQSEVCDEMLL